MSSRRQQAGTTRATPQELRRAWVAARLAGVGVQDVSDWTRKQGLPTASQTTFERAVGPVRAEAKLKGRRGRPGQRLPKDAPALWEWLLVDERRLGVQKVIYRLPNDGLPQAELIDAVRRLVGVRQIVEAGSDRELILVALVRDAVAASDLRAQLEDLAPGRSVKMDLVEFEDNQPAVRTWHHLATSRED
jgi:hypothetical protein